MTKENMTEANTNNHPCRLYLITPPRLEPKGFAETLKAALGAGDVACVQLRLKEEDGFTTANTDTIRRATEILMPIAQDAGAAFLINDLVDLAEEMGADGVHIGQTDMSYKDARKRLRSDRIIGVTCHNSRHLAMEAGEQGADYVAFGAFHKTDTKTPISMAEPDLLTWWSTLFEVPCVAIGGITVENGGPLVKAGADFLAVSAGVWAHQEGPAAAVAAFNRMMNAARE
ncbi:MAG: thiamine phosphate synthase [Alphaproteobacteria bacterium]|nr:thiamine phosphate synthase [Alphaproteobacteria bacterium]MBO6629299.1 thiamine phosphate synthase [Alphaproteobacteria bacterium]